MAVWAAVEAAARAGIAGAGRVHLRAHRNASRAILATAPVWATDAGRCLAAGRGARVRAAANSPVTAEMAAGAAAEVEQVVGVAASEAVVVAIAGAWREIRSAFPAEATAATPTAVAEMAAGRVERAGTGREETGAARVMRAVATVTATETVKMAAEMAASDAGAGVTAMVAAEMAGMGMAMAEMGAATAAMATGVAGATATVKARAMAVAGAAAKARESSGGAV